MLDLKKLEEELDNALENETEESLKKWLYNRRKINNLLSFLYSSHAYIAYDEDEATYNEVHVINTPLEDTITSLKDYKLAA